MAVGINPYRQIASGQTLIESLFKAQQAERRGKEETTAQMGKISKEFEEKLITAEQKAEKELHKKRSRKKKWYEKILSSPLLPILLGAATGGVGAGWIGGLSGVAKGADVYKQGTRDIDFARQQARRAKTASLAVDPRFGKLFTSKDLTKYKGGAEQKYGNILRQAENLRKSDIMNQALMSGLISGVSGYGGAKLGGNLSEAFTGAAGGEEGFFKELFGKQGVSLSPDSYDVPLPKIEDPSRIMEAFTGAGLDMKKLLGETGEIGQSLPLLMMLLQQFRGEE